MLSTFLRRKRSKSEMTFLEHVDDLRVSLLRVIGVFMVGVGAALYFYKEIPVFLQLPLEWAKDMDASMANFPQLREFTFMGVWSVLLYSAFAAGLAIASPFIVYEVARFVGPALTPREKRGLIPFCVGALVLCVCGAVMAFMLLTPMSIVVWHSFAQNMGMVTDWQASDYYSFVVMMSLLTGVALQFPLVLIILMWLELVRPMTLLKSWRGMLFGIVALSAIVTPIGDPVTLGILTGVLFILYLIAVFIGKGIVRRKRVARGDKPDPEDEDLPDEDDEVIDVPSSPESHRD